MEKKDITISSLFIELRNKLNLTQTQLAKELNVSRSTIAKIENKEIDISDKLLFMFLSKYKMNIHNNYNIIFDYKKPEKKPNKILQMIKEFFEEVDDDIPVKYNFEPVKNDINGTIPKHTHTPENTEFLKYRIEYLEKEIKALQEKINLQDEYILKLLNEKN